MVSRKDFMKSICKGISLERSVVLLAVPSSFEGCLRREDTFQSQAWKGWTSRFSAEDFQIVTKLWLLVPGHHKGKQNRMCSEEIQRKKHVLNDSFCGCIGIGSPSLSRQGMYDFSWWTRYGPCYQGFGVRGLIYKGSQEGWELEIYSEIREWSQESSCSRDISTQDEGVSGRNRCREPSHS